MRIVDVRKLDDSISVAPQIGPADVTALAAMGFTAIINNRPDGEEMGQPDGAAIEAVATTLGVDYVAIPVTHAGFSHPQLDAFAAAMAAAQGPVLAYCRSGTRSCNLWALAMAKQGADPEALTAKAAAAGYDLSGIRLMLDQLSAGARG
ncbi:MAG: TIGR01244 family sulfur transferase [Sphingomonas sp.]